MGALHTLDYLVLAVYFTIVIAVCVLMEIIGVLWIYRIMKVEY